MNTLTNIQDFKGGKQPRYSVHNPMLVHEMNVIAAKELKEPTWDIAFKATMDMNNESGGRSEQRNLSIKQPE